MAADSTFTPAVTRLGCLRGVSTLTAFGLAVEVGDFRRLSGRSIGAYLGLVPTESSSGRPARRGRSPRPGTATPAACWWRLRGTIAAPTGPVSTYAADGTSDPGSACPGTPRQQAPARPVERLRRTLQTCCCRQRRHHPRVRRLVLVAGRPARPTPDVRTPTLVVTAAPVGDPRTPYEQSSTPHWDHARSPDQRTTPAEQSVLRQPTLAYQIDDASMRHTHHHQPTSPGQPKQRPRRRSRAPLHPAPLDERRHISGRVPWIRRVGLGRRVSWMFAMM
jgi:Transposase IS116/IS110/IS902 family